MKAAESQVAVARSGDLPKINYTESFTRSNNPVFVFSSLLSQRQFSEGNFAIGPLNRPDFLNNFQSQLTFDQMLFDAGRTRNVIRSAETTKDLTSEEQRRVQIDVIAGIVRAYSDAVLAAEALKAAQQAVRSAEADLKRAESVHAAGFSTDADVLSIRVHLAAVTERRIKADADAVVARAALNDILSLPLDTTHTLETQLAPAEVADLTVDDWERNAARQRPEIRQSRLALNLAETHASEARSAMFPQVNVRGVFEADRQDPAAHGGTNWLIGVSMTWNLFSGFGDKHRIAQSKYLIERARADENRAGSTVRLQVRRAFADLRAAVQRIEVAKAAVAEAEESLRITQNRYQAGMSNVTDLLRNETAVLDSRLRYLTAVHDHRNAAVALEAAAGRLSPDSEVLN